MRTPRQLRAAAEEADPRLPDREKAAAELARFEEKVQAATWRAIRAWLAIAAEAVLTGQVLTAAAEHAAHRRPVLAEFPTRRPARYTDPGATEEERAVLTAAPEDVPPDPASIGAHAEEWGALVDTHIVGAVEDLLGERFAELLEGDQVVSARPWQEQYLARVKNRMADLPGQTFDAVRAEVQLGIDHGEEIPKVRDRIATALSARHGGTENDWLKRSQTIARTETIGAYNGGQLAAAQVRSQATGVQLEKVWLATIDSRTRKDHYRADGQRVPLDGKFQIGSSELDHPGDPSAPAKQVVHCRCTMLEVEPDEETPNTAERQLWDPAEVEQEIAAREADDQIRAFDDPAEEVRLQAARSAALVTRATAAAAAEKKAASAARRLAKKLASQQDDAGVPMRLTFDYLGGLDEDALDDLGAHLASRLDDANPIEGQRWDDYETFMEFRDRESEVIDQALSTETSDAAVTRIVEEFQRLEGRPGLTHPAVGGRGAGRTSDQPTRADVQLEWAYYLDEQLVLIEQATRGTLLTAAGRAKGIGTRDLIGGDPRQAIRYASPELLEYWETNRRMSWSEFYYERTGSPGSARAAANQASINSRIDRDRSALRAAAGAPEPEPSEEQVAAYDAGREAFAAGAEVLSCPYTSADPELLRLWVRGYALARRDALVEDLLADADPVDPAGVTAAATPEGSTMTRRTWRSKPFLAPFAKPTGDGRIFKIGGLTSRDLPLPLLYQESTAMGHDGSTTVGRILEVEFTDAGIVSSGDYLDDPALAESVAKAIALVDAGLGGVSVDLDSVVGSLVDESGDPVDMEWLYEEWESGRNPTVYEQVDEGRLIGVTQVATPAFAEAAIELDPISVGEESSLALEDSDGTEVTVGARITAQVPGDQIGGAREEADVTITATVEEVDEEAETVTVGSIEANDDGDPVESDVRVVIPAASVTVIEPAEDDVDDELAQVASLAASAGTLFRPPAAWYEDPKLEGPTALTVTDDGRVYGHVAVWGTCHVGYPGQCVEPPSSPSQYGYFHVGAVKLDDGTRIAVGNLTLGGGHADPKLAWRQAASHYDRTGFGIATVRAYEDEHGIAVAGALNPGATPEQIAELERSPLSGDWREIGGELDMIGALAVNSGGFPIPRYATGPNGDRLSLVAAPGVRPDPGRKRGTGVSFEQLSARLRKEVLQDVRADMQRRARLDRVVAAVGLDPRSRLAEVLESIDN